MPSCHCLCAANHRDVEGICRGVEDTKITFKLGDSEHVDVAMCSPCAAATLAALDHREDES